MLDVNSTISIDGKDVLRFHPLHKKIKDGIPRCISCGQIDEDGFHEAEWCPGCGGFIPFPTSTLELRLKADNGFRSTGSQRITIEQWIAINRILNDNTLAQGMSAGTAKTAQPVEGEARQPGPQGCAKTPDLSTPSDNGEGE